MTGGNWSRSPQSITLIPPKEWPGFSEDDLSLYSVNPYGHVDLTSPFMPIYFAIYMITTLYLIFCILILYYALFINKYHKFSPHHGKQGFHQWQLALILIQ